MNPGPYQLITSRLLENDHQFAEIVALRERAIGGVIALIISASDPAIDSQTAKPDGAVADIESLDAVQAAREAGLTVDVEGPVYGETTWNGRSRFWRGSQAPMHNRSWPSGTNRSTVPCKSDETLSGWDLGPYPPMSPRWTLL